MHETLTTVLQRTFKIEEYDGPDKITALDQAVRQNVRPGMQLFISFEAGAAICEIIRQYYNKKPGFTLITTIVADHMLNLIHCDLVKKLIFSNCATLYPSASAAKVLQRAYRNGTVELENWSLYSLQQRLMAGALDIGFMPTKCILGSSLGKENEDFFKVVRDPFDSEKSFGVVKRLNPDVSIIHAWAADRFGNVIPVLHSQDTLWGAKASKNGIVVTVEKIVSTEFIRNHSALVKIPGYLVNSVSLAPLGAHPQTQIAVGLNEFESYAEDYEFMGEYTKATQDEGALNTWIRKWIQDCRDHQDYLNKLGADRIASLRQRGSIGLNETGGALGSISEAPEYSETEMMLVTAARIIVEKVIRHHYKVLLVGVGFPSLVGWPAYYQLRKQGCRIELLVGSGLYGYEAQPGDPFFQSSSVVRTCKMLTDVVESYGVIVGGQNSKCISILGAGEVDKYGNINSAKISDKIYLTGAGGANDNSSLSQEVLAVMRLSRSRSPERVTYVTSCGDRVRTLVSTMGVFEKLGADGFTLTKYFPRIGMTRDDIIKSIQDNCGWAIEVSANLVEVPPPSQFELALLRSFDPNGAYTHD